MSHICLTSTVDNGSAIDDYIVKINANAAIPNSAGTTAYAIKQKAINEDLWFAFKPDAQGWGNPDKPYFTCDEMMNDVDLTDIVEQELNRDWLPVPIF